MFFYLTAQNMSTIVSLLFFWIFTIVYTTKCQIKTGLFNTHGGSIFDPIYNSGNMSLFYKMYIPNDIDITVDNHNNTMNIPVLVLLHGSGPQNHDQEIPVPGINETFFTFRYEISFVFFNLI